MLRRGFGGGEILGRRQQRNFVAGGDMQHMQAAARLFRQAQHAFGGGARRFRIAPDRMGLRLAALGQMSCARSAGLRLRNAPRCGGCRPSARQECRRDGSSSSVPVEEPRNALTPQTPGSLSSSASAPILAGVAPT